MSNLEMRHASDEQLLRYADGELPAREAAQVRQHLEACWQCRAGLTEIQDVIGRCVRYRKDVLESALPPPPRPWGDIYRQFDEIELTAARASWLDRFRSFLRPTRWVPVAVAVALLCGVYVRFRETPSVHAAELLRKAVAAAESSPQTKRRIQIRTRKHRITRVLNGRETASATAPSKEIQGLFELARYSWEDPLSARSFQLWRQQLNQHKDEVVDIEGGHRIRTSTDGGALAEATLTLKGQDLEAVEGTLRFRNAEFVEITQLPPEPDLPAPLVASVQPPPALPAVAPTVPQPVAPPAASASDEIQVLARLHQLGADLGEPIEVTRQSGRVLVSGVGIAATRQREIAEALESMPQVEFRFTDPAAPPTAPSGPAPQPATAPPAAHSSLEKALGQSASELLDASDALMARAYALRRLAERFPAAREMELGAEERRTLAQLRVEHSAALAARANELQRLLTPVLPGSRPAPARPPALPSGWQPAAESLFQSARVVERLLAAALGGARSEIPAEELPVRLLTAAAELHANARSYEDIARER